MYIFEKNYNYSTANVFHLKSGTLIRIETFILNEFETLKLTVTSNVKIEIICSEMIYFIFLK